MANKNTLRIIEVARLMDTPADEIISMLAEGAKVVLNADSVVPDKGIEYLGLDPKTARADYEAWKKERGIQLTEERDFEVALTEKRIAATTDICALNEELKCLRCDEEAVKEQCYIQEKEFSENCQWAG